MSVAAFFDIDGTLIGANSARLYMQHMRRSRLAGNRDLLRTLYFLAQYKLGWLDVDRALAVSLEWVRGRDEAAMRDDTRRWYAREVRAHLYAGMQAVVDGHRRAGHVLAVITSATRYLAEPVAADFGIPHVMYSGLVVDEGRFTGEAVRPICYGRGKIHWAETFARDHGVDLGASHFYSDSITDLPLLERVGHPYVVHPDPPLRREAARRGWPVLRP